MLSTNSETDNKEYGQIGSVCGGERMVVNHPLWVCLRLRCCSKKLAVSRESIKNVNIIFR